MSSDEDEDVFYDCAVCSGDQGREPRSDGSAVCKFDGCKCEYAKRRKLEHVDVDALPRQAPTGGDTSTYCYTVKEVVGVSMCPTDHMTPYEKRAGRKQKDTGISYQVRGGFGEDKRDDFIPDTRWVPLTELVQNLDERGLKLLDTFAAKLQSTCKEARKRLREAREREDADGA